MCVCLVRLYVYVWEDCIYVCVCLVRLNVFGSVKIVYVCVLEECKCVQEQLLELYVTECILLCVY